MPWLPAGASSSPEGLTSVREDRGMPMSAYVAQLRALVGNQMLHMPSACVLLYDEGERVLLVHQRESGLWSVPGGVIEPGEVPAEAAAREALEETGLEVEITALRAAIGGPDCRTVYSNGDVLSYVALVYEAVVVGGAEQADGDEISELGWFAVEEIAPLQREGFVDLLLDTGLLKGRD